MLHVCTSTCYILAVVSDMHMHMHMHMHMYKMCLCKHVHDPNKHMLHVHVHVHTCTWRYTLYNLYTPLWRGRGSGLCLEP